MCELESCLLVHHCLPTQAPGPPHSLPSLALSKSAGHRSESFPASPSGPDAIPEEGASTNPHCARWKQRHREARPLAQDHQEVVAEPSLSCPASLRSLQGLDRAPHFLGSPLPLQSGMQRLSECRDSNLMCGRGEGVERALPTCQALLSSDLWRLALCPRTKHMLRWG